MLLTPEAEQEEESYVEHISSTIKSEKKKNDELINQVTEFAKELKSVKQANSGDIIEDTPEQDQPLDEAQDDGDQKPVAISEEIDFDDDELENDDAFGVAQEEEQLSTEKPKEVEDPIFILDMI